MYSCCKMTFLVDRCLTFLILVTLWHHAYVLCDSTTKFDVVNNRIIDETGRESYFHGVNVVFKSPPYLPTTDKFDANLSFVEEDMQLLNSLGQNVIRLGVEWPGVVPNKGETNNSYISKAINIINQAYSDYNIYTLVDSHQDDLSEAFCGEGIPIWATQPDKWNFPFPVHSPYNVSNTTHIPSRSDCLSIDWAEYYIAESLGQAFQNLYQNKNGLRDEYGDYWSTLATSFKDVDGIIGFELLNEPWAGDIYSDPLLVLPGNADKNNLEPFYDALSPKIRDKDSERLVFFESVTWTDEFNISISETGFTHVPGGSDNAKKSVFSFHYYNLPGGPNVGPIDEYFYERTADAIKWGTTSFLTEFDITINDDNSFDKMSKTMDQCDKHLISWIGWEYKVYAGALPDGTCTGCGLGLFNADGSLNNVSCKAVSRTYAMKVAGTTQSMTFDANSGNFTLIYDINTQIVKDPTIVYWSKTYWYPKGYDIEISPQNLIVNVSDNGDNYIYLYNTDDSKLNSQTVTITLSSQ